MDTFCTFFFLISCFTISTRGQAEGVFPDYWQDEYDPLSYENQVIETKIDETVGDAPKLDETVNGDNILNGDEFVDENGHKYNIDAVINSALAEGLNIEEIKEKITKNIEDNIDDNIDVIVNDNIINEEPIQSVVNSDETRVREEIESFRKELSGVGDVEEVENEEDVNGNLDDYQFEDNRSEVKDDVRNDVPSDSNVSVENQDFDDNLDKSIPNVEVPAPNDEIVKSEENEDLIIKYLMPVSLDNSDDGVVDDENNSNAAEPNNVNENSQEADDIQQLIDETNQLLKEDSSNNEKDNVAENIDVAEDSPNQEEQVPQNEYENDYEDVPEKDETFVDYIDGIQEDEIQKFLVEKDNENEQDTFDEQNIKEINDEQGFEPESDENQDTVENFEQDEDTVDKVKADLNEDLERLFNTWNKLSRDSEEQPEQYGNEGLDLGDGVEQPGDLQKDLGEQTQEKEQDLEQSLNHSEDEEQDFGQEVAQPKVKEQDLGRGAEQAEDKEDILVQNLEQSENVQEYENKYGKPYGEDIVLAQREDNINMDGVEDVPAEEENIVIESNLGDILMLHNIPQMEIEEQEVVQNNPDTDFEENANDKMDEMSNHDESVDKNGNLIDESSNIVAGASISVGDNEAVIQSNENGGFNIEILPDVKIDIEKLIQAGDDDKKSHESSIGTDEINDSDRNFDEENVKDADIIEQVLGENIKGDNESEKLDTKSVDASLLTSTQYDDLMRQFATVYSDVKEVTDEKAEVVTIEIDANTPVTITSPNYPEPYPTDNTVDYYFHGEGVGIEFNITDLELNGAIGDYLLIKPGSSDATGSEGLIFSYHLTEARTYRFLDVDRLFVRFRAGDGAQGMKGFSYSVKMVAPLPDTSIPAPSPAPLLPPPATLTVYLGGLAVTNFVNVKEAFRMIVADMATIYVNSRGIEVGLNNTSEVTQITSVGYCNVNWPNFDVCVQVTFGVPLVYEDSNDSKLTEDELYDMWSTLFYRDPFAYRLRQLNIQEFSTPNDRIVLRSWLVVSSGVVISAAMLAFVLWRFSCFQGYTRMSPYSDSDSMRDEKRTLDLYPTPHQTLPPLYSNEYQWVHDDTARVDMGGLANRSYIRDELMDMESDDEIPTPATASARDRYTSDV